MHGKIEQSYHTECYLHTDCKKLVRTCCSLRDCCSVRKGDGGWGTEWELELLSWPLCILGACWKWFEVPSGIFPKSEASIIAASSSSSKEMPPHFAKRCKHRI